MNKPNLFYYLEEKDIDLKTKIKLSFYHILRFFLIRVSGENVLTDWLGKTRFLIRSGKYKFRLRLYDFLTFKAIIKDNVYDFFNIGKNAVVIDVGAHVGFFTILVAKKAKQVIAVEPEISNYSLLKENSDLNNLKNVKALNAALTDKNSTQRLYLTRLKSVGHSLEKNFGWKYETVKTLTLDKLVEKIGLKKIDLIKIDTEGAEVKILQGGTKTLKKYKPKLIIEMQSQKNTNDAIDILKSLNYDLEVKIIGGYNHIFAW